MGFFVICFSTLLYFTFGTYGTSSIPPTFCIQWYEFDCIGGDRALLSTGLWLSYTSNSTNETGANEHYSRRIWVDYKCTLPELRYYEGSDSRNVTSVSYEFEQPEHGGGSCHCFNITDCNNSSFSKSCCGGSPQDVRRIHINWNPSTSSKEVSTSQLMKVLPIKTNCTGKNNIIRISYTIYASQRNCQPGGSVEGGDVLEFSIRFLSNPSEWIPLSYILFNRPSRTICRRGYCVEDTVTWNTGRLSPVLFTKRNIQICEFSLNDSIQLRWLMASSIRFANLPGEDKWSLDDVQVNLMAEKNRSMLMVDNFNGSFLNNEYWKLENIRNGNLSSMCSLGSDNPALVFGQGINNLPYDKYVASHSALTNIISLSGGSLPPLHQNYPPANSSLICNVFNELSTVSTSSNTGSSLQIFQAITASTDDLLTATFSSNIESTISQTIQPTTTSSNELTKITFSSNVESASFQIIHTITSIPDNLSTIAFSSNMESTSSQNFRPTTTSSDKPLIINTSSDFLTSQTIQTTTIVPDGPLAVTSSSNFESSFSQIFQAITSFSDNIPTITSSSMVEPSSSQVIQTTASLPDQNKVIELDAQIMSMFMFQKTIFYLLNSSNVTEQLSQLTTISMNMTENPLVAVYILGVIFNNASSITCENETLQESLNIGGNIIQQAQAMNFSLNGPLSAFVLGSTLLVILERLVIPCQEDISYTTMEIAGAQVSKVNFTKSAITLNTATFNGWTPPYVEASLPLKELELFSTDGRFTMIANIYRNVSSILPLGMNSSTLASDVIGISLQCGHKICPTNNISLNNSVQIIFNHNTELEYLLKTINLKTTTCVFLDIVTRANVLKLGEWSQRGCIKNKDMSSNQKTVCECNHLTHFAILLSARPVTISNKAVQLSLNIVSYMGVSVSLVAMTVLIIIFICFRSLHSLRHFIHANLCINLGVAQVIFIAGIDKTRDDTVPIHCQFIAVLLHYFFLVSFMWMLMEGVFLYVSLFTVFANKQKPYYIAFTVVSYGLPLVYMGGLTLPLGFSYFTPAGYGYSTACYLNPNGGFIWAMIAPVILIFLINIGFFIMTIVIMWKHQTRITDKSKISQVNNWLKATICLTVIMGITGTFNFIVIEVKAVQAFVYIYTILIAFQGLFIFVTFILFSKSIRDAIIKYWKFRVNQSDFLNKYCGEILSSHTNLPRANESQNSAQTSGIPSQSSLTKLQNQDSIHYVSMKTFQNTAKFDTESSSNNFSTAEIKHDVVECDNSNLTAIEAEHSVISNSCSISEES